MSEFVLERDMYLRAAAERKTFSQYLEEHCPAPEGSNLDAFECQLKKCGIVTKSDYARGIHASTVDAFYRTGESAVLFPEVIARTVREAVVNDTVLPYLIAQNTIITGDAYRTIYVSDQPTKQTLKRVTESAELPKVKLTSSENTLKIYKYGRQIEASYEFIRRCQIDMLGLHVRRIAMQSAKDQVTDIISTIVSGDGNTGTAADTYNLTTLDSGASAGTLSAKGLLAFLLKFEAFPCNTLIADVDTFIQVVLTNVPTLSTADLLKLLAQGTTGGVSISAPQLPSGAVRLFWNSGVTAYDLIGINSNFAIEKVTEAGSDISEADKFITRQVQTLTISENSGFGVIMPEAMGILKVNA